MAEQEPTTFTIPDIPDITFTATRGSGGQAGLPSNWITIRGTRLVMPAPTDDVPEPTPIEEVVCEVGFAGP